MALRSRLRRVALAPSAMVLAALLAPRPAPSVAQTPAIVVERHRAPRPSSAGVGDRRITVVRVDPARIGVRLLSESAHGRRRPLPEWVEDHDLVGGINAGMFLPDGRSVGYLMDRGEVRSDRRPGSFEAVLGFHPRPDGAPIRVAGPGCGGGIDDVRRTHRSVLQAKRVMISCRGQARRWRTRRFSAAAVGVDRHGHLVLVHVRTPYRMGVLSRMLVDLDLGLRGLAYMEGGPEASLVVRTDTEDVALMGSWEDGFYPEDTNRAFWDLPNVLGLVRR
ncbi:MAG: phosphodiester glycosidase family protein [Sandaracinaceae bacterium]